MDDSFSDQWSSFPLSLFPVFLFCLSFPSVLLLSLLGVERLGGRVPNPGSSSVLVVAPQIFELFKHGVVDPSLQTLRRARFLRFPGFRPFRELLRVAGNLEPRGGPIRRGWVLCRLAGRLVVCAFDREAVRCRPGAPEHWCIRRGARDRDGAQRIGAANPQSEPRRNFTKTSAANVFGEAKYWSPRGVRRWGAVVNGRPWGHGVSYLEVARSGIGVVLTFVSRLGWGPDRFRVLEVNSSDPLPRRGEPFTGCHGLRTPPPIRFARRGARF